MCLKSVKPLSLKPKNEETPLLIYSIDRLFGVTQNTKNDKRALSLINYICQVKKKS